MNTTTGRGRAPFDAFDDLETRRSLIELGILRLLAQGRLDGEIARELCISPRTYRRHVTSLLARLGARTRAHAVAIAMGRGLIPPTSGSGTR